MIQETHVDCAILVDQRQFGRSKQDVLRPLDLVDGLPKCQRIGANQSVVRRILKVVAEEEDMDSHQEGVDDVFDVSACLLTVFAGYPTQSVKQEVGLHHEACQL